MKEEREERESVSGHPPTGWNLITCPEMPSQANVSLPALEYDYVSSPQSYFLNCLRK